MTCDARCLVLLRKVQLLPSFYTQSYSAHSTVTKANTLNDTRNPKPTYQLYQVKQARWRALKPEGSESHGIQTFSKGLRPEPPPPPCVEGTGALAVTPAAGGVVLVEKMIFAFSCCNTRKRVSTQVTGFSLQSLSGEMQEGKKNQ